MNSKVVLFLLLLATFVGYLDAQDVKSKSPLPSQDEMKSALATVKDVFKDEYKNLKTSDDRKALAKKLLEQASDAGNKPAMTYVLITESVRIATDAGDVATVAAAASLYGEKFEGDAIAAKKKLFDPLTASKLNPESFSLLAKEYLKLADEAIASDDFATASALADSADSVARKAKDTVLISKATEKKKDAGDALNALKAVSAAMEKLKTNPDDSEANFSVGKYVCFSKNKWDMGLPMLAKGSDKEYKEAAELEIAANDTASTLKSADKWWDIAEKEKLKYAQDTLKAHAATKYQKILPELGGIDKVKAEKRLKDATATPSKDVSPAMNLKTVNLKSSLPHEIEKIAKDARERKGKVIKVSLDGSAPGTVTLEEALKKAKSTMIIHFTPGRYILDDKNVWPKNIILEGEKGAVLSQAGSATDGIARNLDIIDLRTYFTGTVIDCRLNSVRTWSGGNNYIINCVISGGDLNSIRGDYSYFNCTFYGKAQYIFAFCGTPSLFGNCVFYCEHFLFVYGNTVHDNDSKLDDLVKSSFTNCIIFGKNGFAAMLNKPLGSEPEKIFSSLKDLKINAKNCIETEPEFENVEGNDFFKWNLRLKPGSPGASKGKDYPIGANIDATGYPVQ